MALIHVRAFLIVGAEIHAVVLCDDCPADDLALADVLLDWPDGSHRFLCPDHAASARANAGVVIPETIVRGQPLRTEARVKLPCIGSLLFRLAVVRLSRGWITFTPRMEL